MKNFKTKNFVFKLTGKFVVTVFYYNFCYEIINVTGVKNKETKEELIQGIKKLIEMNVIFDNKLLDIFNQELLFLYFVKNNDEYIRDLIYKKMDTEYLHKALKILVENNQEVKNDWLMYLF